MAEVKIASFIRGTSCAVMALGALVLVGWQFNITAFKTILPGFVGMNPFTAMSFMAIGSWLLVYLRHAQHPRRRWQVLMPLLAVFVSLVGVLRLWDTAMGTDYAFDDVLYTAQLKNGFVSPFTAFSFTLMSGAMLLAGRLRRNHNGVLVALVPVSLLGIISLFGYLIGNNDMMTLKPFKPMSLHTTLCFLAYATCFLFLFPRNIVARTVLSNDLGGYMARKLLPYVMAVPLVLGFLRYEGERLGLYDTGFGVAIVVVGAMFAFLVVVVRQCHLLSLIDQQRRLAEHKMHKRAHEVDEANRELERRNKDLEQFTYVSHHDLQEPLRKIVIFSDMVKSDSYDRLTEASQKRLDRIIAAARRMGVALRDVLDYSSLNKEEHFVPVDLNAVLASVQVDLELRIAEKEATLQCTTLPTLEAVPHQMHQLLYNLVNNSLKFSRPGTPPVITITCKELSPEERAAYPGLSRSAPHYLLTVKDNGIGFSQAAADKIFQMFQRLHSKQEYEGTGIGLALVRKVVQNHGGVVWAESKEGEGATFFVVL